MKFLRNPRARGLLLGGIIGLFQLFFNRPVLDFDWVYFDDDINILLNPHLTGEAWETGKWAWTDLSYTRRYMPLGWMMFDALLAAGGLNPAMYHLAGWLLVTGNSILLFLIVRKICAQPSAWQDACAFAAVLVVSLHPWRAETAGWCSGLLYLAGQFLASLAVLSAWPPAQQTAKGRILPAVLFGLALLVYPVFLSLPLIMILAEAGRTIAGDGLRRWSAAFRRYGAWLAVTLLLGGLNWFAAATAGPGFAATADPAAYPLADRWAHFTALGSHYVGGLLWPGETSPFYGAPALLGVRTMPRVVALVALVVAMVLLAWPRTRTRAGLILGLSAASLLPFTGLLDQHQTANDRYTFLFLSVATVLLARLMRQVPPGHGRTAILAAAAVLAMAMLPAYRQALAAWTDTGHLQTRIDRSTATHPDARLGYARPAIMACLLGRNDLAADRLAAGVARLGPHPEILAAMEFIRQTNEKTAPPLAGAPRMPPYARLHLELARIHRAHNRLRAAEAHEYFAARVVARQDGQTASGATR